MTALPNPFMAVPDRPSQFDEQAILQAIADELDPPPAFISDPSEDYLMATDFSPIRDILQGYIR